MLLRLIIEIALAGPGASTIARKKLPIELLQGAFWGNVSKMRPTTRRKKVAAHPIDWQRRQIYRPRQGPMGPALRVQSGQRLRWLHPQRRSLRLEFADELERQGRT